MAARIGRCLYWPMRGRHSQQWPITCHQRTEAPEPPVLVTSLSWAGAEAGHTEERGQLRKQSIVRLTINQGLSTRISKQWQWSQWGRLPCLLHKRNQIDFFSVKLYRIQDTMQLSWNINSMRVKFSKSRSFKYLVEKERSICIFCQRQSQSCI